MASGSPSREDRTQGISAPTPISRPPSAVRPKPARRIEVSLPASAGPREGSLIGASWHPMHIAPSTPHRYGTRLASRHGDVPRATALPRRLVLHELAQPRLRVRREGRAHVPQPREVTRERRLLREPRPARLLTPGRLGPRSGPRRESRSLRAQLGPCSQAVTWVAISSATCVVVEVPPRSGVRTSRRESTSSTAHSTLSAAAS